MGQCCPSKFDSLPRVGILKVVRSFIEYIPWDHHQIKIMAADALASNGAGIAMRGRSWKKELLRSVEAVGIAAEYRIPSSEFSVMSAAGPSERWIPSSIMSHKIVAKVFWHQWVQLNFLNNTIYVLGVRFQVSGLLFRTFWPSSLTPDTRHLKP